MRNFIRRVIVGGLFVLAMIFACRAINAQALDDENTRVPEYFFFSTDSKSHCVIRADIPGDTLEGRKSTFVGFLDRARILTSDWQKEFVPVGIDYANYRYFHVALFDSCENLEAIRARFGKMFGVAVHISTVPDDHFVGYTNKRVLSMDARTIFRAYGDFHRVENCAISIPVVNDSLDRPVSFVLYRVWRKYRFSIAVVHQVNDTIYVIFSRQCSKKSVVARELISLAKREDHMEPTRFGDPDMTPDLHDYFLSVGVPE